MQDWYVVRTEGDKAPTWTAHDTFEAAWSARGDGDVMEVTAGDAGDAEARAQWAWGWGGRDAAFCTRDGVTMSRRVLLPAVASFDELFEAHEPWNYSTMSHVNGSLSDEGRRVRNEFGTMRDGVEVGPFASVNMTQVGGERFPLAVKVRADVLDRLDLSTMDDRWSWELIAHKDSGRVLVIGNNGFISGRWVAYIDADTVPVPVRA